MWQAAQALIGRLYAIEKPFNANRPAEDAPAEAWADWRAARARKRAEEAPTLLDACSAWCRQVQAQVKLPKDARFKAAAYSSNQEVELRRYAEVTGEAAGMLEIDNNACERSIRPTAIGRKNWLFTGSHESGEAAAVMFSLIASAKRHDREPRAYLEALIRGLAKLGENPSDAALEPWLADRWAPDAE